ncbi:MAG: hypothetical protein ABIQ55_00890 [Gemmatimonadaceae bacterium]
MINRTSLVRALIVLACVVPPSRAMAQQSDADWMNNCKSDRGDYGRDDSIYWEVRTATARPSGDVVSMEGLQIGGVSVTQVRGDLNVQTRPRSVSEDHQWAAHASPEIVRWRR